METKELWARLQELKADADKKFDELVGKLDRNVPKSYCRGELCNGDDTLTKIYTDGTIEGRDDEYSVEDLDIYDKLHVINILENFIEDVENGEDIAEDDSSDDGYDGDDDEACDW